MAIVGSAYVVVRAISTQFNNDLKKAIEEAGTKASPSAKRAGEKIGKDIGEGASKEIPKAVGEGADKAGDEAGRRFSFSFGRSMRNGLRSVGGSFTKFFTNPDKDGNTAATRFVRGWSRGISKIPTLPIIALLALPAIGAAINAVALYVGGLVSVIGVLGQALVGLAGPALGGISALAQGMVALKLAFRGATPEIEALKASAKSFNDDLAAAVQGGAIPGFQAALNTLGANVLPVLREGLRGTGVVLGEVAQGFANMLSTAENTSAIGRIMESNNVFLRSMGSAATSLGQAFITIVDAARPVTEQLGAMAANGARTFAAFVQGKAATGELTTFFQESMATIQQFGRILRDFGAGIGNIFKAAMPSGESFIARMEVGAAKFREWTASAGGQNKLQMFFQNASDIVRELNGLIGDLGRIWGQSLTVEPSGTIAFIQAMRSDLIPALQTLYTSVKENGPSLSELATSFSEMIAALANSGALGAFTGTLQVAFEVIKRLMDIPILSTVLGWGIAFGGFTKAMNLVTFGGFGKGLEAAMKGVGNLFKSVDGASSVMGRFASTLGNAGKSAATALGTGFSTAGSALSTAGRKAVELLGAGAKGAGAALSTAGSAVAKFLSTGFSTATGALSSAGSKAVQLIAAGAKGAGSALSSVGSTLGGLMSAGFAKVGPALAAVGSGFKSAAVAARAFGAALLANPVVLIVAGIIALGAALVWAYNKFEPVRAVVDAVGAALAKVGSFILDVLIGAWNTLVGVFQPVIDAFKNLFSAIGDGDIGGILMGIVDLFLAFPKSILGAIGDLGGMLWDWISGAFQWLWDGITTGIGKAVDFFTELPGKILGAIGDLASAFWDWITGAFDSAGEGISEGISNVVGWFAELPGAIISGLGDLGGALLGWIGDAFAGLGEFIGGVWDGITGAATATWDFVSGGAKALWDGVTAGATAVWDGVTGAATWAWEGIKGIASTAWNWVSSTASTIWSGVTSVASGAWEGIKGIASSAWGWISSTAAGIWNGVTGVASGAWEGIKGIASSAWNWVSSTASSIWSGVSSTAAGVWDGIKNTASSAWNWVSSTASGIWGGVKSTAEGIWGGIKNTASTAWGWIKDNASGAWDSIKSGASSAFEGIKGLASKAWEGIKSAASSAWSAVTSLFSVGPSSSGGESGGSATVGRSGGGGALIGPASSGLGGGAMRGLLLGPINAMTSTMSTMATTAMGRGFGGLGMASFAGIPSSNPLSLSGIRPGTSNPVAEITAAMSAAVRASVPAPVNVRVYIGERELVDMIGTEYDVLTGALASDIYAGQRNQL